MIDATTRHFSYGNEGLTKCIASEIWIGSAVISTLYHNGVETLITDRGKKEITKEFSYGWEWEELGLGYMISVYELYEHELLTSMR